MFSYYGNAKQRDHSLTERELLEHVAGQLILPGTNVRLMDDGMTGKQYIDHVFKASDPDLDQLINHIICLEYPSKYKAELDINKIREQNRSGKRSVRDNLEITIKNYHEKILG